MVTRNSSQQRFLVEEGTIRDRTLFHSFDKFSPDSWSVVFDLNDVRYNNIDFVISRVTGQSASFIDGNLSLLGNSSPDLFLINPAGISFGANATLTLPGSFIASTAENILFDSQTVSAVSLEPISLLSVSVPTGLQMGSRSAAISYAGTGHTLTSQSDPLFAPYQFTNPLQPSIGLQVPTNETLALVGNGIQSNGGILAAAAGNIDLLSLSEGQVDITHQQNQPLTLRAREETASFQPINFARRSLVNVSGTVAGNIHIHGGAIALTDASVIWSQNRGADNAGELNIQAAERLSLSGRLTQGAMLSSVMSSTIGSGMASNVSIQTPSLTVIDGSSLGSRTFVGTGKTGSLSIDAADFTVDGFAAGGPQIFSRVGTFTAGSGWADTVTVDTTRLNIRNGGYLGSTTIFSDGEGGDVSITAQDIEVTGTTPTGELSLLTASSIAGSGNAGNLTIKTERLNVLNSGSVLTSSFTAGSAGMIDIIATDSVLVGGRTADGRASSIASAVVIAPQVYQDRLGPFPLPTGHAGEVTLRTGSLQVNEDGIINAANLGAGQAGTLNVTAQTISLTGGDISAITASGQGGNIDITADTLTLSQDSNIQATSFGLGNGGNINIESSFVIGQQNSDIVANAVNGSGGNISMTTQGIYGLKFREQLTDQSDITASSEFGVQGTVEIANVDVDVNAGIVALPSYFSDTDDQVAASCDREATLGADRTQENQFVASGRGGLATNPIDRVNVNRPWQDIRPFSTTRPDPTTVSTSVHQLTAHSHPNESTISAIFRRKGYAIAEAAQWQRNAQGQIELVASTQTLNLPVAECLSQIVSVR